MTVAASLMATVNCWMGFVTDAAQRAVVAGHVASPPPEAVAVLVTPADAAVGVTLMVKLAVLPGDTFDRPVATVQVTVWPLIAQPAEAEVTLKPAGTVSVTVAAAVVAVVPVLLRVSV